MYRHIVVYSAKTKSTVSIHSSMWRWSLLKSGHFVWLELASIFLSLVFEKTLQMAKKLAKIIGCRYICYHICRRNYSFSLRQNIWNLCQPIFVFLTVYYDIIFEHWLESSSISLRVSFFIAFVLKKTQIKMLKAKVNIQVLKVNRRLLTLFKPFFRGKEI